MKSTLVAAFNLVSESHRRVCQRKSHSLDFIKDTIPKFINMVKVVSQRDSGYESDIDQAIGTQSDYYSEKYLYD